jgi:hypothetical protein
MNLDSLQFSALFEKSLLKISADFRSEKTIGAIQSELSKELKRKVSKEEPGSYNIQLTKSENEVFTLKTSFFLYRDCRLIIINLLKWIERNGKTDRGCNFIIDLKFNDVVPGPFKGTLFNTATKIENIDKLKFIVELDEAKIYDTFPSRRNGFISQSIQRFDPIQKFIPKEAEEINPNSYRVINTEFSGVSFETLVDGFLRFQYIGGSDYEKKINEILQIVDEFCITAWNCTINKGFTRDNISKFHKLIQKTEKIRESYLDYQLFKANFPKIKFTVDLLDNEKLLSSYFDVMKDRLHDLLVNIEFTGELEINYDTSLRNLQVKDSTLKCTKIDEVEFVNCKIEFGRFTLCDFYDCEIKDAILQKSNLFQYTSIDRGILIDSFANRTSEVKNSEFSGLNGVLNCKMESGIFRNGKIGVYADIQPNVIVIEYQRLKVGFTVMGDKIIIPTKKYRE